MKLFFEAIINYRHLKDAAWETSVYSHQPHVTYFIYFFMILLMGE